MTDAPLPAPGRRPEGCCGRRRAMSDAWAFLDLDGTLTDAAPGITRSLDQALRRMGVASPGET
ncbi:MAG: hypothetical protein AAF192_21120, partial [Pseudomonadota bacterium]